MGDSELSAHNLGGKGSSDVVEVSEPSAADTRRAIVSRWVDAFNARDLDAMLACLAEGVDFHPCRLSGLGTSYSGHDGVREWFGRLERLRHEHKIVLSETRDLGDGRVFARGRLSLGGSAEVGPFSAVQRIDGGLIVAAHHYLTEPDLLEALGLVS